MTKGETRPSTINSHDARPLLLHGIQIDPMIADLERTNVRAAEEEIRLTVRPPPNGRSPDFGDSNAARMVEQPKAV